MSNPFGVKPLKFRSVTFGVNEKKAKRTLGIRDKQILYRRAGKRCEACGRKIDFDEMESGHKNRPASKGGAATLRNSVCECARCNKLQGTDSFSTFMRKMGKKPTSVTAAKRRKKRCNRSKISSSEWPGSFNLPKLKWGL